MLIYEGSLSHRAIGLLWDALNDHFGGGAFTPPPKPRSPVWFRLQNALATKREHTRGRYGRPSIEQDVTAEDIHVLHEAWEAWYADPGFVRYMMMDEDESRDLRDTIYAEVNGIFGWNQ